MNLSKTIKERRSIRKFKPTPIPQETIVSLLHQAAGLFESEGTPQWRCIYYRTPESRQRLGEKMIAKMTASALGKLIPSKMIELLARQAVQTPAIIVFIASQAPDQWQRDANYAAVCSIIQNFQLLGWESGLGMLWYTEPFLNNPSFCQEIGLQEGERFAGMLNIGAYDKMPRARKRTPAEQKWTAIAADSNPHAEADNPYISSQSVLAMLNDAVWAPNDGLREPWRFIYVTGEEALAKLPVLPEQPCSSVLIIVATEESDPHKREEDYAAVCCLVQNFQLLAQALPCHVRRTLPAWIYNQEQPKPYGIRPAEQIVAVLELGTVPFEQQDPPGLPSQSGVPVRPGLLNITIF